MTKSFYPVASIQHCSLPCTKCIPSSTAIFPFPASPSLRFSLSLPNAPSDLNDLNALFLSKSEIRIPKSEMPLFTLSPFLPFTRSPFHPFSPVILKESARGRRLKNLSPNALNILFLSEIRIPKCLYSPFPPFSVSPFPLCPPPFALSPSPFPLRRRRTKNLPMKVLALTNDKILS